MVARIIQFVLRNGDDEQCCTAGTPYKICQCTVATCKCKCSGCWCDND